MRVLNFDSAEDLKQVERLHGPLRSLPTVPATATSLTQQHKQGKLQAITAAVLATTPICSSMHYIDKYLTGQAAQGAPSCLKLAACMCIAPKQLLQHKRS
jgi:hypothetical protein